MPSLLSKLLQAIGITRSTEPLTPIAFRDQTIAALKKADPSVRIDLVSEAQITIHGANGTQNHAFLTNNYARYRASPHQLQRVIGDYVNAHFDNFEQRSARHAPGPSSEAIYAVLKSTNYADSMRQHLAHTAQTTNLQPTSYDPVQDVVNSDLTAYYVFDSAHNMSQILESDLALKHLDRAALPIIAQRTLRAFFARVPVRITKLKMRGQAAIYQIALDGNYEASILFLPEYWTQAHFPVKGEMIAFPIARDSVIVVGAQDADGMQLACAIAEKEFQHNPYAISPHGYAFAPDVPGQPPTLFGGRWLRFT